MLTQGWRRGAVRGLTQHRKQEGTAQDEVARLLGPGDAGSACRGKTRILSSVL